MVNSTTDISATMMCMTIVSLPDTPPEMATFSVSGVLQTAIKVPSSLKRPISRIVKPPTSSPMTIFTSSMLGVEGLSSAAAISPRQHSWTRCSWLTVG